MKKLVFCMATVFFTVLACLGAFAVDTVYVDGVGTDANCYATLKEATAAVDNGGTVIVKANITTYSGAGGEVLAAKDVTITSEGGATLTLGRVLFLGGDTTFTNIKIKNGAPSNLDSIYCAGHDLVVGADVTTEKNASTNRYPIIFAGTGTETIAFDNTVTVSGGTWRSIYSGSYSGVSSGKTVINFCGGTISGGALIAGSLTASTATAVDTTYNVYGGTVADIKMGGTAVSAYQINLCGGTVTKLSLPATVDLTNGGRVTVANENGQTIHTATRNGYTVAHNGTVYSVPFVALDGTGATKGAQTDFASATKALPSGGDILLCGDTTVGTASSGVVTAAATGSITVMGVAGNEVLTVARSLTLGGDLMIDNLVLNSTATLGNVLSCGHKLTIGEAVTATKSSGAVWLALFGGAGSGTTAYDTELVVKSGTFRCIYGANYGGTATGASTVTVSGVTVEGTLSAGNYQGTHSGAEAVILDLCGGKTVSAGTYKGEVTCLVDDGCEAVRNGNTYSQQPIEVHLPRTVYVDGVGGTENHYATLALAVAEMPGGGTVILTADTEVKAATVLAKSAPLTVTAENGAKLTLSANLTLGGDTTFAAMTFNKTGSGNVFLVAGGHTLVIEKDVVCLNYSAGNHLSVVGGVYSGSYSGDTHIEVKGGFFRNIYGGNYNGNFVGDTFVKVTGGVVRNSIVGGNFVGNFKGNTEIILGGDGEFVYNASSVGVVGGSIGSTSTTAAYTFEGNTSITVQDDYAVCAVVFGGCRYKNVAMTGDTTVTVKDNAFAYLSVYGSGYFGHTGNATMQILGGETAGNVVGGAYSGDVSGNVTINLLGGRLCREKVNDFSAGSDPAGARNVYAGCMTGSVGGTATVTLDGAEVYGSIFGGNILAKSGVVYCALDGDSVTVEILSGKTLSIDAPSTLTSLSGSGKLVLAPEAYLTVGALSGNLTLAVNGKPLPADYITAAEVADGTTLNYAAQSDESLYRSGNVYSIDFDGSYKTVTFTVLYNEGCESRLRYRTAGSGATITPVSQTATSATYALAPGLYKDTVVYSADGGDYNRKSVYIDGRSASVEIDMRFPARAGAAFASAPAAYHTDEVLRAFFDENDLVGYATPDTPYFNARTATPNIFTTNAELVDFLTEKAENCPYLYVFNLATSPNGYQVPLALFTPDKLPEGVTLAEAAKIVSADKTRDILMVTGGIHGNEPTGTEGSLAFISEMCGEYGRSVLEGTKLGAVLVIPRQNPEGFAVQTRETPVPNPVDNLNRDFMLLSSAEIAGVSKAYQLFMPTVTVDCHEALTGPVCSDGDLLTDVYDLGIMYFANAAAPQIDGKALVRGDKTEAFTFGDTMTADVLDKLGTIGVRTYYYPKDKSGVYGTNNFGIGGAFSFIMEAPGIAGGNTFFARRTFVQMSGLKAFVSVILEADGAIARQVSEARKALAVSAQIYDAEEPIALNQQRSRVTKNAYVWNNPLVGMDGTVRVADNPTYLYPFSNLVRYRSRPTAYVFPADLAQIDLILQTLDKQGIAYLSLVQGTTMQLHNYTGSVTAAYRNPQASAVTFESGAYLVPVDGERAGIIAILFEPDCNDFSPYATLTQMDYIPLDRLYASTENFIAAKNGMNGSYLALDLPDGKTPISATVNGVAYTSVASEDGQAFVLAADAEYYTVKLTFDDASEQTYAIGSLVGDANGDGQITVLDVLVSLRHLLNDGAYQESMDINGDGKLTLTDIVGILKQI